MTPKMLGLAALVAALFYLACSTSAKPLTQGLELSSADRLHYFGQTEAQDYELVSPRVAQRRRRATRGKHIETTKIVAFQAFGEDVLADLKPVQGLIDAGTLVHEIGEDGKTVLGQPEEYCLYQGTSVSHENSAVYGSDCGNKLEATVTTDKVSLHLQPLKPEHVEKDGPTHMVVRRSINREACNMNAERNFDTLQTRRKRSTTDPIYVDTSVVADDLVYKTYRNNTKNYILTVLNQVAGLLKDPSLDVKVNLKINNIKILKTPQADLPLSEELENSLRNFCDWQKRSDSDISILITRHDLVSAGNRKITGKAADVGGACDPNRRCLIGQDHGPSGLIFTLAHEIGHSLGMYHDGGLSDCANRKNIMASVNSGGPDAFHWSECSNSDLLNFLAHPESKCLKDKPKSLPEYTDSSIPMPGFYYNASQQCALTFNENSAVASEVLNKPEICQALVCKNGKGVPDSTNVPPLDGTRCGTKRDICIQGSCLKVYSTFDCEGGPCIPFWLASNFVCTDPVNCTATRSVLCVEEHDDGTTRRVADTSRCPTEIPSTTGVCPDNPCRYTFVEGEFSECPVSCGTGIQIRSVVCQDQLEGVVVEDLLCTQTRPSTTQLCNAGQCPTINVEYVMGEFQPCSVTCGTGVQVRSVECRDNEGNQVAESFCLDAGLSRPSSTQACDTGVSCGLRYVAGPYGQCSVSCGIGIRTRMIYCVNDNNLVVAITRCQDASLEVPTTDTTCELEACPTPVYTVVRGAFGQCSVSCGSGTESRLVVCLNNNVQVDMQNCIDAGLTDLGTQRNCTLPACQPDYRFQMGPYGECSVTCGEGQRFRDVQCLDQNDQVVDVTNCLSFGLIPPESTIVCSLDDCPTYVYQVGEFGPCSETCGNGVQIRTVVCINNDTRVEVADSICSGEKPATTQPCNLTPCISLLQFVSSPFSACNCSGLQTRLVVCIRRSGNILEQVPVQACLDDGLDPLPTSQECTPPSTCVQLNPVWQTTEWNGCSVTCGVGTQGRLVYCIEAPGSTNIVDESECIAEDRPPASQECDTQVECPTAYLWLTYDWGPCSVTCGLGFESRDVFCFNLGDNFVQVEDSLCNAGEKPPTVRPCSLDPCSASWTTSDWSECSVSCGPGMQTRTVACQQTKDPNSNLVEETECVAEDQPSASRPCYLAICPAPYGCETTYMLEGTVQYTDSSPGFANGQNYPNDLDCDKAFVADIPATEGRRRRRETETETPQYYIRLTFTAFDVEPSPDCSFDYLEITDVRYNTSERLCGNSYELPLVWTSVGPDVNMFFHTDATVTRPGYSLIYSAVEKEDPARYVFSEWSECSVTCGEGVQTREVTCVRGNQTVDDIECSGLERPASTQPCEEEECVEPSVCSGDLIRTEDNSFILSPDFPSSYPNNVSCFNVVRAPEGMVVQLTTTFFNLRPSADCEDRVLIKDVNSDGDPLQLCGTQAPGVIFTSITNEIAITFISAETGPISPNGFGFTLQANFINEQGSPCGQEITTSGQAVYSPNYPDNYDSNQNCLTVIRNDNGCIQLRFLDVDLPPFDGQCSDFVQLVDLNLVNVNTGPICGQEIPSVFYSATGLLTVRFFSDENGPTRRGYNAVARFVECTAGLWFTGPYGECSATCGESYRTRTVVCQDPRTMDELDPSMCPLEVPESTIDCEVEECPSCDVEITAPGDVSAPISPGDLNCVANIANPEGCVTINFLGLDLVPDLPGTCETDYLEIIDAARQEPIKMCGSMTLEVYQSLSGNVQLIFQRSSSLSMISYFAYVSFNACPVNAYITGNWSECSVTCGSGVRTRDVQCMDLINNVPVEDALCQGERPPSEETCDTGVECPSCDMDIDINEGMFVTSPGFPEGYTPNLNCLYNFDSPLVTECIRLTILEVELGGSGEDDLCSADYVELSGPAEQAPIRICPESGRSISWYSRSNQATLRFVTDEEGSNSGFNVYIVNDNCIEYDYDVGPFGPCNVRCGGGVRTRDVTCIKLDDQSPAADELCRNPAPLSSMPCNTEPCPVCDETLLPGNELITSPGFSSAPGRGYESLLDCTYNVTNPEGCLFLTFLSFELQDCSDCTCDSLSIYENGELALEPLCGDQTGLTWGSSDSNAILEFRTDNAVSAPGFNIYVAYVECPDVYFYTGEYSECDVTCGGGTQTREVSCRSRTTGLEVEEAMCTSTRPPSSKSCAEQSCPFCDEVITTPSFVASPDYPASYPVSINCNYDIQAPLASCISITFVVFDLQEAEGDPAVCSDFVEISDTRTPLLDRQYCGAAGPNEIQWNSYYGNAQIRFHSDEEDTSQGFRAYVGFVSCPDFGYMATEFGECSRPCGGGVQTRIVTCVRFATLQEVDDSNCADERPIESRPCNLEECPECDQAVLQTRQSVSSLNFPQPYFEYSCNYLFINPGGCVELLFVQLEMPEANAGGVCDTDYLLVEDLSSRPFSYRICGREIPGSITSRGETLNVTLVTDGNPATFGEGYQLYNLFTNDCPQVGFVTGEFGECDRQCGFGQRTREVTCVDLQSGIEVDENLCTDRKPASTEFCNTQPCPSCDRTIDSFPQALDSPMDLDLQRTCRYTLDSERCIRATFLQFDFPGENGMCGDTFVELRDEGANYLTERFCGDGPGATSGQTLYAWESRTEDVVLTLNSGSSLTTDNSFRIFLSQLDCPEFAFVTGEFGECSVTCGDGGTRTRTVQCRRLVDGIAVIPTFCTDPEPSTTEPCGPQPPCPSCDMTVTDGEALIQGPPRDGNWTTDVNCRITVEFESSCVVISALELSLSEPDVNGNCVDSSLTFSDGTFPNYTQTVCGSPGGIYRALTNRFVVDFFSADYENSGDRYSLFVQEATCPNIIWDIRPGGQCSVSCGGGIQTREVVCLRTDTLELLPPEACPAPRPPTEVPCNVEECPKECDNVITANTPVTVLSSPGRPTYVTDADCLNNIVNLSGCITLSFLSMDIEGGTTDDVCDKDYLEIIDSSFPELNVRLCGSTLPTTSWRSKSGLVRTRFVSDSVDTLQSGYSLTYILETECPTGMYVLSNFSECSATCGTGIRTAEALQCLLPNMTEGTFNDCPGLPPSGIEECNTDPCPEFYFFTGNFDSCPVTCGIGVMTRVVECRRVDNDTVVDDSMCTEPKPDVTRNCALGSCPTNSLDVSEPAQSYSLNLDDSGTIRSPNYPSQYPNSFNGQLLLSIPAGSTLEIVVNTLDIVFETPCSDGDSLMFQSGTANVLQICSNSLGIPFSWYSQTGDTSIVVTFTTSATNAGTGFSADYRVFQQ
ncbi:uncharacterized protein LOC110975757 [Acanthaster planci]|uniref:Uncharacterized protein LOC110975757 n=1 Tax=Acanthaster planci TaxID=133434 RepID=A0A8B7XVZ0_ACAPL|nr:uncharacterized protein LOC110975757 [Acanthaster planci]